MTGFGRFETVTDEYKLSVEMKAVNHRYLDISVKLPRQFGRFETGIRKLLKEHFQRGKIDVFVTYQAFGESLSCLVYNRGLAAEYIRHFAAMEKEFGIPNDVAVSTLLRCPEVFSMETAEADDDLLWQTLAKTAKEAALRLSEARTQEGERLKADLLNKLHDMSGFLSVIEKRFPHIMEEYRARLLGKVRELLSSASCDEGRIVTEVAVYADKICVDEETVRLKSHIEHTRLELSAGGAVGRKLDFIAQEMNREANTILSKTGDQEISDQAIALKTEIEKVREQIQNIE